MCVVCVKVILNVASVQIDMNFKVRRVTINTWGWGRECPSEAMKATEKQDKDREPSHVVQLGRQWVTTERGSRQDRLELPIQLVEKQGKDGSNCEAETITR